MAGRRSETDFLLPFFCKLLFEDLHFALGNIGTHRFELVLRRNHRAVLRTVALEVNRVKLALRGADAAADALIRINDTSSAAEAAGSFCPDLFLGEGNPVVFHGEGLFPVDHNFRACRFLDPLRVKNDLALVEKEIKVKSIVG